MRLDKYLKVSRLIKRRTVANDACDGQRITVNGRTAKASYDVKIGDVIEIALGQRTVKVGGARRHGERKKRRCCGHVPRARRIMRAKNRRSEQNGGFAVCQIMYLVISLPVAAGSMLRDRVN